jgi:hypothetical protein
MQAALDLFLCVLGLGDLSCRAGRMGSGAVAWQCFHHAPIKKHNPGVVKVLLASEGGDDRVIIACCSALSVHHMQAPVRDEGWRRQFCVSVPLWLLLVTHVDSALVLAGG